MKTVSYQISSVTLVPGHESRRATWKREPQCWNEPLQVKDSRYMYLYLGTSYMYCSNVASLPLGWHMFWPLPCNQQMVWITTCGIPHTAYMVCSCLFVISILCSCEIEEEKACQESRGRPFVLQRHSSCCLSIQLYIMKATSRFLT